MLFNMTSVGGVYYAKLAGSLFDMINSQSIARAGGLVINEQILILFASWEFSIQSSFLLMRSAK